MTTIKTHTFSNGFRLVYEKSNNVLPISAVNVFCNVGSIHETDDVRGASHMIEHMCFKGTKTHKTAKEIFIEYDKIGAYFNAFTTKRYTAYVFKCSSKYIDNSISILADMMLNSTFVNNEYDRERDVVAEENIDNENDPEDEIFMQSDKLLYSGSSFEKPVDCVSYHGRGSLPRNVVFEFYKKYYVPENMLLSIVTDLSFEKVKRAIENSVFVRGGDHRIGALINRANVIHDLRPQKNIQFEMINKRGVENIVLTIGFRVCNIHNSDRWKLDILQNILSGTMSGRIFMKLREKNGLIYSSDIETNYYDKTGDFVIFTQTDRHLVFKGKDGVGPGLLPSFVALLNDLVKNGVDKRELEITKGYMKGNMLIEMEDINTACEYNGSEHLMLDHTEDVVPFSEIYKRCYENITNEQMNEVIRKYLRRELMSVCILGEKPPNETLVVKEFNKFLG